MFVPMPIASNGKTTAAKSGNIKCYVFGAVAVRTSAITTQREIWLETCLI